MPQAGIYEGIPFAEYRSWGGVSQSVLKIGREHTWAHARAYLAEEWSPSTTSAMRFGSAVHCWLLEPEEFARRFVVAGGCGALIKSGDRRGHTCGARAEYAVGADWRCGVHAKGTGAQRVASVVTEAEVGQIQAMERQISAHPACRLLRHPGGHEVSFCCELEGVPFRGRADRYCPKTGTAPAVIIDLKKMGVGDGLQPNLLKKIRDYGYDLQAAAYVNAIEQLTGDRPAFVWLFIEDSPPHLPCAVRATQSMLTLGWLKARQALHDVRDCLQSGYWPGYSDTLVEIDPEPWELRRHGLPTERDGDFF